MCGADVAAMEANARLIAAAPDLLVIARRLVAIGGFPPALMVDAATAVAKAEGRQS
jgi:hypothetical protein